MREKKGGGDWGEGGVEKGIKKTYHDSDIGHEEEDGFIHRYGDSDEQAWGNKNELNCTRKKKTISFLVSVTQTKRFILQREIVVVLTVAAVTPYGFPLPCPEPIYQASIPTTRPVAVPP